MISHPQKTAERAVVVTTLHCGVFFGYTSNTDGATIQLRAARNCLYWDAIVKGFIGLGAVGPIGKSRVGPAADIELRGITCIIECLPNAVKVWEAAPWK